MSIAALDSATSPTSGVQAAVARIAELQTLAARAQGVPDAAAQQAVTGGATFPAALASATTPAASAGQAAAAAAFAAPATAVNTPVDTASLAPGATSLGAPSPYDGLIAQAAQANGIDPAVLKGLVKQESGFDPNATSPAGAIGLAQLMPGTASSLGVSDPRDPAQSIDGAARYLRQQLDTFGGDVSKALAAYNAGPGAVQRFGGIPPYAETQQYVQKVLDYADGYRAASAQPLPTTPIGSIT